MIKKGILLDIGCGDHKNTNFVGMDKRKLEGVDIVHDLEVFPYPLEDESCLTIVASHILEHIKPWLFIDVMNELWRLLVPNGQLASSHPYAVNDLFVQDPTHCNPISERTYWYFDPDYPLYQIYKPCPWRIEPGFPTWQVTGNMECVLRKRDLNYKDSTNLVRRLTDGRDKRIRRKKKWSLKRMILLY